MTSIHLYNACRIACLLVLLLPQLASAAAWSPDGKQLAYSYVGGPESIYLINVDGSGQRELLVREQRDFRPEWAPDGSHLVFTTAFEGNHVVMRIDRDGSNLRPLTEVAEAAGDPDYSPDGTRLVYFSNEPRPRDLYVKDVASGDVTALTTTEEFQEMSPRWAPDGRRVVFVGRESYEGAEGDIWVLDVESGERTNLTRTPDAGEFHPDWSHDGTRVVFIRARQGRFDMVVRVVDTGAEEIAAPGNGYAVVDPHFSLDDRKLTFTRTDFAEKGPGMPAITLLSLSDGAEATIVRGLYVSQMTGESPVEP